MKNSISSIKNRIIARPTTLDENSNEVKSTNINILLNRVKSNQKNEIKRKLFFALSVSSFLVLFGAVIF